MKKYLCLSLCLYLSIHVLNRVSVTGRNELEMESEVVHAREDLERQILSNTSVREEVTVVGDWVSCTGGAVGESKKSRCAYKSVHFPRA